MVCIIANTSKSVKLATVLEDNPNAPLTRVILININHLLHTIHIYPTPPLGQDVTQGQFLSGV